MRILKFGGKSLSSEEKVQNVSKFIKKIYKKDKNLVIVVSAMGAETQNLTDLAKKFGYENNLADRELAVLLSTGEIQSASLVAINLLKLDVPAKSFTGKDLELVTFGGYLSGKVCYLNKTKILECFKQNVVAVVCGFQGINYEGETTTLGLGGSDTTATALASAFDCPAEIYSDFDGVFSGDPRILPYKKLKNIDYDSMLLASRAGAKVLDEKSIELAKKFNIKIISKSSSEPEKSGSTIFNFQEDSISISKMDSLCKITIVFNNPQKLKTVLKAIVKNISETKFYNFKTELNEISFYVKSDVASNIISNISKDLKLIKN